MNSQTQIIKVNLNIGAKMRIETTTTMTDYITASQQTAKNVLKEES